MELNMKKCSVCKVEQELFSFYKQHDGKFGVTSRCKSCLLASNKKYSPTKEQSKQYTQNWLEKGDNKEKALEANRQWRKNNLAYDAFRSATYRASKKQRTPTWANLEEIKKFYLNCPTGYHVDHIVPLRGVKASGLHVETNLQYLPAKENLAKRNLYGW